MTVSTQGQCSLRSGAPFRFEQWRHEQVVARPCIAEPVAHGQARFPIQLLERPYRIITSHVIEHHVGAVVAASPEVAHKALPQVGSTRIPRLRHQRLLRV